MTIGNMPVGGAQPPNAVIGGVMATVFAISSHLDTTAAVGLAVSLCSDRPVHGYLPVPPSCPP